MSYNGSGTFQINTSGQPVVTGTVISSTAFNALTSDLATGLSTAITKDGQTTTTTRIPFAQGINSSLATDSTSTSTGSIITVGGVGIAKALYVGTTANIAGNVLVGTTSTTLSGFYGGQIFASGTSAINACRNDVSGNSGAGLFTAYSNYSTTEEKFIVRANGDVQNRTGSYTSYSDERLKENITDARNYLSDLTKLRVVNYYFKAGDIKTKYLGFVAQEVEKVIPGLVFETENDGLLDCKGIKLTVLIPMLVKAIQEQQALITSLTARVVALESK